ncbi:MAG TPA: class I SAM-dependent methyltransferase [Terracidiphilus sp.]
MTAMPQRDPYQGMLQIVRFNWPKYVAAMTVVGAALCAGPQLSPAVCAILFAAVFPAACWILSSLLVSHYIYDRSHLYELKWLARALRHRPKRWLNVHCGLDETSPMLSAVFPESAGEIADIFDPCVMTESSIRRAREAQAAGARSTRVQFNELSFSAGAFDEVFCIFAAHELRHHADRVRLFAEIERVLSPAGDFVLVEHLRDWRNFLAFGPGFLHFHSWRAWLRAADEARLALRVEFRVTPFVRVAIFGRVQ